MFVTLQNNAYTVKLSRFGGQKGRLRIGLLSNLGCFKSTVENFLASISLAIWPILSLTSWNASILHAWNYLPKNTTIRLINNKTCPDSSSIKSLLLLFLNLACRQYCVPLLELYLCGRLNQIFYISKNINNNWKIFSHLDRIAVKLGTLMKFIFATM